MSVRCVRSGKNKEKTRYARGVALVGRSEDRKRIVFVLLLYVIISVQRNNDDDDAMMIIL